MTNVSETAVRHMKNMIAAIESGRVEVKRWTAEVSGDDIVDLNDPTTIIPHAITVETYDPDMVDEE